MSPHVIWPAPCLPAFPDGPVRCLTLLVEADDGIGELRRWGEGIFLQSVADGRRFPLRLTEVRPHDSDRRHPYAKQYLRQRSSTLPLFDVEFETEEELAPSPPRSATVFDLRRGDECLRARSVAILRPSSSHLRIAFATDLHVASAWDSIAAAIDRHAPDLFEVFCHPQRLLAEFVKRMNRLAERGELDLVVLGGDLVDHVFPTLDHPVSAAEDSNVQLLLDLLRPLTVPVLAVPGNHDYRVNPWRPRSFGLGSVGIPKHRQAQFLKPAGLWDAWRLRPSDWDALRTHAADGRDGLLPHLTVLTPATDFHVDLRGTRLIGFATGRDMILRWRGLDWTRRVLLARALPTTWEDPDSVGPNRSQVRWLEKVASGARHAALFFHAPLLSPRPGFRVEQRLAHIHPGEDSGSATQLVFERRLQRSGLRGGVSFRNVHALLRTLLAIPGGVATFSGHVHRSSRIEVDRRTLRPSSAPIDSRRAGADILPLHIAAALGHVRAPGSPPPSYLLATFDDGILRQVEEHDLPIAVST